EHEFVERKDGFSNFVKKYQLGFQKDKIWTMNQGLMYSALKNKKMDMIMAYSTDGRIKAFDLKTLKDDKHFFPAYEVAYLTRSSLLTQYPKIKKAFKDLEGNITEKEMIFLNNQVDQLKYDSSQTARNFLIKKNLLEDNIQNLKQQSWLDYYISKKDYFFKIFYEHLLLIFVSLFFALLTAIPIGLWASYSVRVEKIVFLIVNTLQTVPSLALLALFIPFLGIGFLPAVVTLFIYSLLPVIRNTFEGIKNIDRVFISAGAGIGLNSRQILRYVQIPLALPMILAGVRTSAVIVVGTATLAAFIGAGGLGDPIFRGIATLNSKLIFLGAVPACLLAVFIDRLLAFLEVVIIPKGLKLEKNIKSITLK
ncbi:MAG: ABC transporter permease subunit, partial [Oligoflexia bacterium]|nr:ABC transporter permease subunit [Oligoflexia bacterium]